MFLTVVGGVVFTVCGGVVRDDRAGFDIRMPLKTFSKEASRGSLSSRLQRVLEGHGGTHGLLGRRRSRSLGRTRGGERACAPFAGTRCQIGGELDHYAVSCRHGPRGSSKWHPGP